MTIQDIRSYLEYSALRYATLTAPSTDSFLLGLVLAVLAVLLVLLVCYPLSTAMAEIQKRTGRLSVRSMPA